MLLFLIANLNRKWSNFRQLFIPLDFALKEFFYDLCKVLNYIEKSSTSQNYLHEMLIISELQNVIQLECKNIYRVDSFDKNIL